MAFHDVSKAYDRGPLEEDEDVWCGEVYQSLPMPVSRCGGKHCTGWSAVKMVCGREWSEAGLPLVTTVI